MDPHRKAGLAPLISPLPMKIPALLASFLLTGLAATAQTPTALADPWVIQSGPIDPDHYFGDIVANGMLGITSAPAPFRTGLVLLNGAFDTVAPERGAAMVSGFHFLDLQFSVDGERIERLDQVSNFRQQLHLKEAVFSTTFDVQDKASISCEVRALRQLPHSALLVVTVVAKQPVTISASSLIRAPEQTTKFADHPLPLTEIKTLDLDVGGYDPKNLPFPKKLFPMRAATAKTWLGRHTVAATQSFIFDDLHEAASAVTKDKEGLTITREVPAGTTQSFALLGSAITTAHTANPLTEAMRLTMYAASEGPQRLIANHQREWQDLWQSDIVIEGDPRDEQAVRSMIYHLYSFIREGSGYSISPMGLSRSINGYFAHVFWDADVWMMPALLALHPPLAKSMLEFRYNGLPAARKRAAARGFKGAMYPWEAGVEGIDETPGAGVGGEFQHHITADVGIAAWNYYCVTQDRQWLRERGYPLLKETAEFWMSRVARHGPGRYDIERVNGADEYAEFVDNDAYTNAAVREHLAAATAAAKLLKIDPNPDWEEVRKNIPIHAFPDGILKEHATYHGEKIKQADVVLLAYPLRTLTDPDAIRRNVEYYDARTDHAHGPAMTKSIYATIYQRLGMAEEAHDFFQEGYQVLERPPFGALAECKECKNPYLATGAGGLIQSMLYGFGGLHITDKGLVHKPTNLPAAWKSLTLTGVGPHRKIYTIIRESK
jgi:trehalose/maltose hydrolase-like predicted phosphorylase